VGLAGGATQSSLQMADSNTLLKAGELERLSALETLKGLSKPDEVKVGDLVAYLESRGLWRQFAKITLGDLRDAFKSPEKNERKKIKRNIFAEALAGRPTDGAAAKPATKKVNDGGLDTEEVARQVLPFIEGNGEVTLEDVAEYTQVEKKIMRYHLKKMVEANQLECLGVGRNAIYSTVG
jgi:DNA-binding transcriptional ArsR family regulator